MSQIKRSLNKIRDVLEELYTRGEVEAHDILVDEIWALVDRIKELEYALKKRSEE